MGKITLQRSEVGNESSVINVTKPKIKKHSNPESCKGTQR